jgi:hypothetical protein
MRFVQANVVQAMRHHLSFAVAGKVMIPYRKGFSGVKFAAPVKIAEHLFLLGIHGEYRLARRKIPGLERRDVFKLRVTLGMLFERFLFLRLTTDEAVLFQELTNNPTADLYTCRADPFRKFRLS